VGFTKQPYEKSCYTCKKTYETKIKKSKFCSPKCIRYCGPKDALRNRKGKCWWKEASEEERLKGLIKRYENAVIKKKGCWGWKQKCSSNGYGKIQLFHGKNIGAHRASWIIHNGEFNKKLWVLHKCDNPPCTNPDHLFLGTPKDNSQDCSRKNRKNLTIGSARSHTKLNEIKVKKIKDLLKNKVSWSNIAKMFSVSTSCIQGVAQNKVWKHVS